MSTEEYSNRTLMKAIHIATSRSGELMQQDRASVRGKGDKETRENTYDAIFTFEKPLVCSESDIPMHGGYFMTDQGKAEVTQLIGRFNTKEDREAWLAETLEVTGDTNT